MRLPPSVASRFCFQRGDEVVRFGQHRSAHRAHPRARRPRRHLQYFLRIKDGRSVMPGSRFPDRRRISSGSITGLDAVQEDQNGKSQSDHCQEDQHALRSSPGCAGYRRSADRRRQKGPSSVYRKRAQSDHPFFRSVDVPALQSETLSTYIPCSPAAQEIQLRLLGCCGRGMAYKQQAVFQTLRTTGCARGPRKTGPVFFQECLGPNDIGPFPEEQFMKTRLYLFPRGQR